MTAPAAQADRYQLLLGDALDELRKMPDASVDAVATDPPYGLKFMGKGWDAEPPGVEIACELLRVAKPGAHLVAFGGTRTYHRVACGLEDAGWEIRDCLAWIYGSGFPKSLDVSKALDAKAGINTRDDARWRAEPHFVTGEFWTGRNNEKIRQARGGKRHVYIPTDAARQWQGWGTALKPSHEPVVLARKPLIATVAANVEQFGTGALNVDGCRVASDENCSRSPSLVRDTYAPFGKGMEFGGRGHVAGRWPPNVLLGHGPECYPWACQPDCPIAEMDRQSSQDDSGGASRFFPRFHSGVEARFRYAAKASSSERNAGLEGMPTSWVPTMNDGIGGREHNEIAAPRVENVHPTVKPVALMRWLVRLITPPGGLVLDPFMGSGTTGVAALAEGFRFTGVECEPDYYAIAERRIQEDMPLFNRPREIA